MKKRPKNKEKYQWNYKLFLFKDKINRGGKKTRRNESADIKNDTREIQRIMRLLWQLYASKLNSL